jgi:DNA-binding transcriptional LysR family regulator
MDQVAAMRAFVRVVEAGTFTRAADLLRTPKPTVTRHIQSLEAHLRTKLLNRTTRRVTVTPDGAAYYERVVRLLADLDELDGGMTLSQASLKGRIRIDVSASLALLIILPELPKFHARYPEIQIDLGVTDRPVDLIAENVDCVVRAGELTDQSLIARRVGELRFVTCAAPAYLARHGEPRHPLDLEKDHYVVSYFSTRTSKVFPLSFRSKDEEVDLVGRYAVSVNDGNAYLEAALVGMGVAQIPAFMAQQHLASGALRPVLTDWKTEPLPLHVVYPPNRHLSNKLRVFVDWIADLFAGHDLIQRSRTIGS